MYERYLTISDRDTMTIYKVFVNLNSVVIDLVERGADLLLADGRRIRKLCIAFTVNLTQDMEVFRTRCLVTSLKSSMST